MMIMLTLIIQIRFIQEQQQLQTENDHLRQKLRAMERRFQLQANLEKTSIRNLDEEKNQTHQVIKVQKVKLPDLVDRETQCNYIFPLLNFKVQKTYFTQCQQVESFKDMGQIQSKQWTLALLSCILAEKVQADLSDYTEVRSWTTLQDFTHLWFLKKFGIRQLAFQFYCDFYASLKHHQKNVDRIQLFLCLLGLDHKMSYIHDHQTQVDAKSWGNPNQDYGVLKLKFQYYFAQSPQFSGLIYQVAGQSKIIFMAEQDQRRNTAQNVNIPLFPNLMKPQPLLKFQQALKIVQDILNDHNMQVTELESHLKEECQNDGNLRKKEVQVQGIKETDEEQIRVDPLIRFILNIFMEQQFNILQQIYVQLKLKCSPTGKSSIQINEFQQIIQAQIPRLMDRQLDLIYNVFVQNLISDDMPLDQSLVHIVPHLFDDQFLKSFFPFADRKSFLFKPIYKLIDGGITSDFQSIQKIYANLFDPESDIVCMSEVYQSVKNVIEKWEQNHETLQQNHSNFANQLGSIEFSIYSKLLIGNEKTAVHQKLEQNWILLKKILAEIANENQIK